MTRSHSSRRERRRKLRRDSEKRLLEIVIGDCEDLSWNIDPQGESQKPESCGKCLPCRVRAKLGFPVVEEILDNLENSRDRRLFRERRRQIAPIKTERRYKTVRRLQR